MRVVPTRSVQAGLAAMIAYDPERAGRRERERRWPGPLEGVATGEVTIASRDVTLDGVERAQGRVARPRRRRRRRQRRRASTPSPAAVAERLLDGGREILTLLTGADEPQLDALVGEIGDRHPDVEIEIHAGGQPHYPLLLSAE